MLQPHEQRLFKALLELAIEALASHHSNDFDLRPYLTQAQGEQLMQEYHAYNGDPEEYQEGEYRGSFYDYALLGILASKLFPEGITEEKQPDRWLPPEHVSILPLEVDCIYTEESYPLVEEAYPTIDDDLGDLDHPL